MFASEAEECFKASLVIESVCIGNGDDCADYFPWKMIVPGLAAKTCRAQW